MKQTIVIVDDSPTQAILLRRILTQGNFHDIETFKNGQEALDYLKLQGAALVISDVNMPVMSGYELCKHLKTDPQLQLIPFILCTVLSDPQEIIHGIEYDADNYITKPYNSEILLSTVRYLLSAKSQRPASQQEKEEIQLGNQKYYIGASRQKILDFLFTTYQNIFEQAKIQAELQEELKKAYKLLETSNKEQEHLLTNILPLPVAQELLAYGAVTPLRYEDTSVMFFDFVNFTGHAKKISPQQLLTALEYYFDAFDNIIEKHQVEKIKTIGDGYMCVGGVPISNNTHALDCILAGLEVIQFIKEQAAIVQQMFQVSWEIRIGINSGPVIAGVIGKKRIAYDIWGDTVNIASRMESLGEAGKITISAATYDKVKSFVEVTPKGKVAVTQKKHEELFVEMYTVNKIITS